MVDNVDKERKWGISPRNFDIGTGSLPPRFVGNFAVALSAFAPGALLALGEMVCVLRCEDILLGSSLMKKREVLWVDNRLRKPNLHRRCF